MFVKLRERFGAAGLIVAVIALVLAVAGGAFAAGGGLNSKQKKEVKKIAKSFQGKGPKGDTGAPGPAGSAGATGNAGAPGSPGKDGVDGTDGEDGTNGDDGMCSVGNPSCVLPPNATETGDWSLGAPAPAAVVVGEVVGLVPISFPMRLEEPLAEEHVHYINAAGDEVILEGLEFTTVSQTDCPGTVAEPLAEPGHLCIYEAILHGPKIASQLIGDPSNSIQAPGVVGAGTTGAILGVVYESEPEGKSYGYGTWAVTAE